MKSPHYKEKWFQALVLLCLVISISVGLDSGIDLDAPRNQEEEIAAELKNAVGWMVGFFLLLFFYISYGVVSVLHWTYYQLVRSNE